MALIVVSSSIMSLSKSLSKSLALPEFPWPPPRASAFDIVPRDLLLGEKQTPVSGDAAAALDSAFRQAGYSETSYYGVPEGFALASRIEQINQDGTLKEAADRWSVEVAPLRKWSLHAYLERLFKASPGYYRIIVFIVTSQPFSQSNTKVTAADAHLWVSSGLNRLPDEVASRPYSPAHACTALIYEFARVGTQPTMSLTQAK